MKMSFFFISRTRASKFDIYDGQRFIVRNKKLGSISKTLSTAIENHSLILLRLVNRCSMYLLKINDVFTKISILCEFYRNFCDESDHITPTDRENLLFHDYI